MGILEPITHKEEIEYLLNDAQSKYDTAQNKFESQRERTAQSLEKLGKRKIEAWSDGMDAFVKCFSSFNNIEVVNIIDTDIKCLCSSEEPEQMIINMKQASLTANELAEAGVAAIGTGALVGIASYGGAMMFGTASTGTAIAALSGAAKTNATLAFFGGGSKAVGGMGMAGGSLVLAGIVAVPILAVGAVVLNAKSKTRLAEAKKIHAEAIDASEKINIMTTGMSGIETLSDNYASFIYRFGNKFRPFVKKVEKIKAKHPVAEGELIDFNELTAVEQKTLHLAWLMAQIYYNVLSATILTDEGKISTDAEEILYSAEKEFKQFKKDTLNMSGDGAKAADILWESSARKMKVVNFIVMAIMILAGVFALSSNVLWGLSLFIGAVIACPIFIVFKAPSAGVLWKRRIKRLVCSVVFVILAGIIF